MQHKSSNNMFGGVIRFELRSAEQSSWPGNFQSFAGAAGLESHLAPFQAVRLQGGGLQLLNPASTRVEPSLTFHGPSALKTLALSDSHNDDAPFGRGRDPGTLASSGSTATGQDRRSERRHPQAQVEIAQLPQSAPASVSPPAPFAAPPPSSTSSPAPSSGPREGSGEVRQLTAGRTKKRLAIKIQHAGLKRLVSGAFAGAVSRTVVAPLETIRTHLMVGSAGKSLVGVATHIWETEGWKGLFRGNGVNVIRVAPSKAIELFVYDTIKKCLTTEGGQPRVKFPIAPFAGATAGVCSTLATYPLELVKTRLTIQRGMYNDMMDAFVKIARNEGPLELYRGLTPSLIGVIPYAATNYFAYDFLRRLYRKARKQEHISNIATLVIGSTAAAISSASTFPLEVARKQMQVGALSGRVVYRDVFHALTAILEKEGLGGLYRGLGASCMKLMPAAGISFMCYEAFKQILINEEL